MANNKSFAGRRLSVKLGKLPQRLMVGQAFEQVSAGRILAASSIGCGNTYDVCPE